MRGEGGARARARARARVRSGEGHVRCHTSRRCSPHRPLPSRSGPSLRPAPLRHATTPRPAGLAAPPRGSREAEKHDKYGGEGSPLDHRFFKPRINHCKITRYKKIAMSARYSSTFIWFWSTFRRLCFFSAKRSNSCWQYTF